MVTDLGAHRGIDIVGSTPQHKDQKGDRSWGLWRITSEGEGVGCTPLQRLVHGLTNPSGKIVGRGSEVG